MFFEKFYSIHYKNNNALDNLIPTVTLSNSRGLFRIHFIIWNQGGGGGVRGRRPSWRGVGTRSVSPSSSIQIWASQQHSIFYV